MKIREALKNDTDDICRLLSMLFDQELEFKPDIEAQLRGVTDILCNPDKGKFFVVEDSKRVVGAVSLLFLVSTALGGKVALLEDMVIEHDARGKGFGKKLLEHVIQYAIKNNCLRITVLTDKDNLIAQSLYERIGFKYSQMIPMRLVL